MADRSPRSRRRLPLAVRALLIVVLVYAGWCGVLYVKQDSMVFPRQLAGEGVGVMPKRPDLERLWVTASDGVMVEGWFFRAREAAAESPKPCVVFFHGNGELIDHMLDYADFYLGQGLSVLLVEYRGYGRSGGTSTPVSRPRASPSERAIVEDSLRFVETIAARPEVDASKIVYAGRSLGSGVAAAVAARRRPAAIILESPFTSVAAFARGLGAPGFIVRHPFRTDVSLPPLAAAGLPVLILHSREDEIIPFSHAQRLGELMPSARLVELSGSHNAVPLGQEAYEREAGEFLERIAAEPGR